MDESEYVLSCLSCKQKCETDEMLQTEHDEYVCKECFRKEFYESKVPQLRKHRPNIKILYNPAAQTTEEKMFADLEQYVNRKMPRSKYLGQSGRNLYSSQAVMSKRPLQCPYPQCGKYIGVLTFDSHFKYEHKDVPLMITHLDGRTSIQVYLQDIQFGVKYCVLLLSIQDENNIPYLDQSISEKSTDKSSCSLLDSKVSYILLATKVAPIQLTDEDERNDLIDEEFADVEVDGTTFAAGDKILIWLTANISTSNSYTVAASTLNNDLRIKYYGPILTIGDDPVKLCEYGQGLILTNFHYVGMSENGQKPLSLDIVIHPED